MSSETLRDCRGIPVSYSRESAIAALERAHETFLAFSGDPLVSVNAIIEQHPQFIMAHLFKAGFLTQIIETRVYDDLVNAVATAENLSDNANDRERAHLRAVKAWTNGEYCTAIAEWEGALAQFPLDLLALQLIHLTQVMLGDIRGQRDVVARVFSLWGKSTEGFAFVLGFYAFGLEENADYERAEQLAEQSLQLRPDNPYAVHAICHAMDMQGKQSDGLNFMYEQSQRWSKSEFAIHLWWHTALLHLDLQDFEKVLDIYDNKLRTSKDQTDRYEEYDAAALLWRLELVGYDVGDRWSDLADKWEPSAADTLYAFNNVHAMMTFAADTRHEAVQTVLESNERYVKEASHGNVAAIREVGLLFCTALADFGAGRYSACVDRLLPIRQQTDMLGGSAVQRDVLAWTRLEAAIRAGRFEVALALANELCELKPASPQRWLDVARAQDGVGDISGALKSREKAQALLLTAKSQRKQT